MSSVPIIDDNSCSITSYRLSDVVIVVIGVVLNQIACSKSASYIHGLDSLAFQPRSSPCDKNLSRTEDSLDLRTHNWYRQHGVR